MVVQRIFLLVQVDRILQYFPNTPRFVSYFAYLCAVTEKYSLCFETEQKMSCVQIAACTFCRHFTLFFPAVSISGNKFSAEII